MAVKSRREENTAATRAALLSTARGLFVARGYGHTAIDDVAAAARVSKGAVYHHFRDKAELFAALFADEQQRVLAQVVAVAAREADPWKRLLASVDEYLVGCLASADHCALLQQAPAALGADRCRQMDEDLALPVLRGALAPLLERGVVVALPLDMLARVLFAALCAAAMTATLPGARRGARQEAKQVVRAVLVGLRARA